MKLVCSGLPYLLHGLHPGNPEIIRAFLGLRKAFVALLELSSTADEENRGGVEAAKMAMIEAICEYEKVAPLVCRSMQVHITTHLAEFVYRWNSLKNMWQFFGERYFPLLSPSCTHECLNITVNIGKLVASFATCVTAIWPSKILKRPW